MIENNNNRLLSSSPLPLEPFDFFEDNKYRKIFISKTLGYILLILICVSSVSLFLNFTIAGNNFIETPGCAILTAFACWFLILNIIVMICFVECYKSSPIKYILYILLLFSTSWILALFSASTNSNILISIILMTTFIIFVLNIYCILINTNFSKNVEYYFIGFLSTLSVLFLSLITNIPIMHLFLAGSTSFILSSLIIFHIKMIINRKYCDDYKYLCGMNDSIFAASSLYISIYMIFYYFFYIFN